MNIITNNPYRILGVYSNAPTQSIVANIHKAKAYLKVGKEIEFNSDLNAIFPKISRTIETIDAAYSDINQPTNKIEAALFWFANNSPLDEIALGHLIVGNIDKATEILVKKESYSSLINLGLIYLLTNKIPEAVKVYTKILHDNKLRTEFISNSVTDKFKIEENKLTSVFYSNIIELLSIKSVLKAVKIAYPDDYEIVKEIAIAEYKNKINFEIRNACEAGKSSLEQLDAGQLLIKNTKTEIKVLQDTIGESDEYQIIADNLAKQILQCGINYYNSANNVQCAPKAMELQSYALTIAVGKITRERCQDNVNILKSIIESLPPQDLYLEFNYIEQQIKTFLSNATISKGIELLFNCAPYLAAIKELRQNHEKFYLNISTKIVTVVLNATIKEVNMELELLDTANTSPIKSAIIQGVKNTIEEAWRVTSYMSVLEIDQDAKIRFNKQKESLERLCDQAGIYTFLISTRDFKIETETEIFNNCNSRYDYQSYIQKFPSGKYIELAKRKLIEIKQREEQEKSLLTKKIAGSNSLVELESLKPSCYKMGLSKDLDDKYFSLCRTKSDYRKYLTLFSNNARHKIDAEEHLKFDVMLKNIGTHIKDNKGKYILASILLIVGVSVGLIWGLSGYSSLLMGVGVISGLFAFGAIQSREGSGCLMFIICGIIAVVSIVSSNAIDEYISDQEEKQKEEQLYSKLLSEPTLSKSKDFLEEYPYSIRRDDALKIYFNKAQYSTINDLEYIIKEFSTTQYAELATKRIEFLCDSLYKEAEQENTIEGWRKYQSFVGKKHYADSEERIEEIENIAWNTDSKAWKQATSLNTVYGYQKYLDLYPNGRYKSSANKKIIDIQVANVYAGEHGELPSMDKVGYSYGTKSIINIENSTSYTLTLLYSGPDSKRVVIAPNRTQSVSLKNGTYRIAASVSASNVRNFAGTEQLTGGSYSVEYYIVTTRY